MRSGFRKGNVMEIKDFSIGMQASLKAVATDEAVLKIADASGDYNPVHIDDDYAKNSIFGGRIAHGLFCLGLISNLLGNRFPGPGTILMNETVDYLKPVYIDDEITATVEVISISGKKLGLSYRCANQNNLEVMKGTALVKVL